MKTSNVPFLYALFSVLILGGCSTNNNQKLTINVGTKLEQGIDINYKDLCSLLTSKQKEDVLLATYSRAFSTGCACWGNFRDDVISGYMRNHNVPIYTFDTDLLDGHEEKFGIRELTSSDPDFYLFKDGKKIARYSYGDKGNNIVKSYKKFEKEMETKINLPTKFSMYSVNEDYLDSHLATNDKTILYIGRNGCGDCSYVLPNVLVPFFNENPAKQEILVLDIQTYRNNDETKYNEIKSKFNLTSDSNHTFGFDTGVVPTFQYYEKGELKDAAVYFNDSITKDGDSWKVTTSYYTEERLENLSFLKNSDVENKVLIGITIPNEDLATVPYEGQEFTSWTQDGASKYHTPILQQFLKTYCL